MADSRSPRLVLGGALTLAVVLLAGCGGDDSDPAVARGRAVAQDVGCLSCHSTGTDDGLGPGLGGIWGEDRTFADGTTGVVDENYLRRSVLDPDAQVVEGFQPIMPQLHLTDEEFEGVVAYLRDVAGG